MYGNIDCETQKRITVMAIEKKVLDGTDLILSIGGAALGFSTTCKISTTTETGERVTKEASAGKWKEKFVKSFFLKKRAAMRPVFS